jgi:TorA maturation chaperone TorD
MAEAALARSLVYRLLSQTFSYPMPAAVAALREEDLPLALAHADALPPETRDRVRSLAAALDDVDTAELEIDYRGVFSHVHSADCPMFETDYGARDVWRQSNTLADIAGFYRAFGIREHGERPDHVSAELEFLHLVVYKQAWALARDDPEHADRCADAERAFLTDHVLRWVPGFAARAVALGDAGPYGAAARLTDAMLRAEAERLGVRIAEDLAPGPPGSLEDQVPAFCEAEP